MPQRAGSPESEARTAPAMASPVRPLVDEGLGNSSYLVEVAEGLALAVDPSRDPGPYLDAASARGLRIAWVAETHLHADFVSGARELADAGATVLAAREAGLAFAHRALEDEEEVDLGGLTLRALATPGHTPEHLSFLLLDAGSPLGVFTGGALLPGGVGRTDLIEPELTEPLARELYRKTRGRLLALPDATTVYPTHGAGSFCSTPAGGDRVTTIGRERTDNPLLSAPDEETFLRGLLEGFGTYPTYFSRLREVNRSGPAPYGRSQPSLPLLEPEQVRRLMSAGAQLVDARPAADFAAGHVRGALGIELRPAFATWLGWLVPEGGPLVFALGPEQDRAELVRQCLKVGYEDLAGELAGGPEVWRDAGMPWSAVPRASIVEAAEEAGAILDVRQASEFASGHIPGAVNVELGALPHAPDLPEGRISVACAHGERATTAASVLERRGRGDVTILLGGPEDWSRSTGQRLEPS